jgi:hypothetical protein
MLEVVREETRIRSAFRQMQRRLKGERLRDVELQWQGGRAVVPVQWRQAERFWWHASDKATDRWWFVLGHSTRPGPEEVPTCEINVRKSGHDRRLAGAVLRDEAGALFLAHSGRIGGARSGSDRSAFRKFLVPGNWQPVRWPDGVETELHVVGHIGSPRFARQLGRFVREVQRYKERDVDPTTPLPALLLMDGAAATPLESLCDQGLVLDALDAELRRRGADGADDLFAHRFKGERRIVELGVDASADGVYRLLGRLMARSAEREEPSRKIAVLPQGVPAWTETACRRLGVGLVRFGWKGERAQFEGLDHALG